MSNFDSTGADRAGEPEGIPENIGDSSLDHAPAAADDGTTERPTDALQDGGARGDNVPPIDESDLVDTPGTPDAAAAAAGPTQATTSGTGPAPAAGQDRSGGPESPAGPGPSDSVAAAEAASDETGAGTGAAAAEAGAHGGLDSGTDEGLDPVTELAEDVGLAPGASDVVDPGQDNGLNS